MTTTEELSIFIFIQKQPFQYFTQHGGKSNRTVVSTDRGNLGMGTRVESRINCGMCPCRTIGVKKSESGKAMTERENFGCSVKIPVVSDILDLS